MNVSVLTFDFSSRRTGGREETSATASLKEAPHHEKHAGGDAQQGGSRKPFVQRAVLHRRAQHAAALTPADLNRLMRSRLLQSATRASE